MGRNGNGESDRGLARLVRASRGCDEGAVGPGVVAEAGSVLSRAGRHVGLGLGAAGVELGGALGRAVGRARGDGVSGDGLADGARAVGDGQRGGLGDGVGLVAMGQGGGLGAVGGELSDNLGGVDDLRSGGGLDRLGDGARAVGDGESSSLGDGIGVGAVGEGGGGRAVSGQLGDNLGGVLDSLGGVGVVVSRDSADERAQKGNTEVGNHLLGWVVVVFFERRVVRCGDTTLDVRRMRVWVASGARLDGVSGSL